MMEKFACLICDANNPLVLAGNSYFVCRDCTAKTAPAKPKGTHDKYKQQPLTWVPSSKTQ